MYESELILIKEQIEKKIDDKIIYINVYGTQNYGFKTEDINTKLNVFAISGNKKPLSSKLIETTYGRCYLRNIGEYTKHLLNFKLPYIECLTTCFYTYDSEFEEDFFYFRNHISDLIATNKILLLKSLIKDIDIQNKICTQFNIHNKLYNAYRTWLFILDYFQAKKDINECFYVEDDLAKFDLINMKNKIYSFKKMKIRMRDIVTYAHDFQQDIIDTLSSEINNNDMIQQYNVISSRIIEKYKTNYL